MNSSVLWLLGALILLCLHHCTGTLRHELHYHRHHHHLQSQCLSLEDIKTNSSSWVHQFVGNHVKWEQYSAVSMVPDLERIHGDGKRRRRHSPHTCPKPFPNPKAQTDYSGRSISPWRYRIDEDEHRYPSRLAFAECLCSGCINATTGAETSDVVSVLLKQKMMVLRRKPCPQVAGKFTFKVEYIEVPVGCTCVIPRC